MCRTEMFPFDAAETNVSFRYARYLKFRVSVDRSHHFTTRTVYVHKVSTKPTYDKASCPSSNPSTFDRSILLEVASIRISKLLTWS